MAIVKAHDRSVIDERVALAMQLIDNTEKVPEATTDEMDHEQWLREVTPCDIVEEVSKCVVGQEKAVWDVANYICMWLTWHFAIKEGVCPRSGLPAMKALSLTGGTASGKTFIVRQVLRYLKVDFKYVDAAVLTGSGWHGPSVA